MILKFLYPPNLEHANSTGRLDLLAMYGPVIAHHSVDYCFCHNCMSVAKEQLNLTLAIKAERDSRKKGGATGGGVNQSSTLRATARGGLGASTSKPG